jgi:hypothetical protein
MFRLRNDYVMGVCDGKHHVYGYIISITIHEHFIRNISVVLLFLRERSGACGRDSQMFSLCELVPNTISPKS